MLQAVRTLRTRIWPGDRACPGGPLQPLRETILVGESGEAIVPHPAGGHAIAPIGHGINLAWAPTPELGGVTLIQFAATGPQFGIATTLTRQGLRRVIADLQSIDEQLGEEG